MLKGGIRTRIHCALLVLAVVPASSQAQTAGPSDQETVAQLVEQIKQLQQQDHDLLERIKILELKQLAASPAAEIGPSPQLIPPLSAEQTTPPPTPADVPHDWHDVHGIQWRGFGEVDYQVLNQRKPELAAGGFVGGSAGNFYTCLLYTSRCV